MHIVERFFSDDSGSNALEYGLIVALVSLAVVTGASAAGTALGNLFTTLGTTLTTLTAGITA